MPAFVPRRFDLAALAKMKNQEPSSFEVIQRLAEFPVKSELRRVLKPSELVKYGLHTMSREERMKQRVKNLACSRLRNSQVVDAVDTTVTPETGQAPGNSSPRPKAKTGTCSPAFSETKLPIDKFKEPHLRAALVRRNIGAARVIRKAEDRIDRGDLRTACLEYKFSEKLTHSEGVWNVRVREFERRQELRKKGAMAKAQWQKQRQEEGRRQNNERKKDLELTFRMLDWQRREVKKAQEGSLAGSKKRKLEDEDDTPAQMPYYKGVCQIDLDVGQMYRTKEYVQEQEKRQFDEATQGRVQIPGLDPRNVMPSLPSIPTSLIDPLLLEQQPQEASSSTLQSYSPIDPRLLQPTPGTKKRKRDDDETSSTPSCKKQRAAPLSDQETCRIV